MLAERRAAVDALEGYCLNHPFAAGAPLQAALLLSGAYAQGGMQLAGNDTSKLMRLFDQWLTSPVGFPYYGITFSVGC